MDAVGVMAAYLSMVPVCTAQSRGTVCVLHNIERHSKCTHSASLDCAVNTRTVLCSTHTHHVQISCRNTDYVPINGLGRAITVILAKHCIKFPDDGSLVIQNMLGELQYFKYFIIILIVSTNNMFVHLLDDIVF